MKEMSILKQFARRIKELRKLNKMSQEKLAEKAGLSTTFIGNIERAEKDLTLLSLEKIARAFNISVSALLGFPDDKQIIVLKVELINESLTKAMSELQTASDIAKDFNETIKITGTKLRGLLIDFIC